jgi:Ca2+-binding EF-hand superfamily protein
MGKGGTDGGVSPAAQQLARARESDPGEAVEEPRLARAAEPKGPHRAAWVVSPQQAMRELFEAADEDASGALDRDEVARFVGLLRPSKSMTAVDVDMAMRSMDSEGSGLITFEQFSRWWMSGGARTPEERRDFAEASKLCHPRESIRAIFEMIDVDRGGTLDREEIRKAGTVLGKIFSAEELDAAMSVMDKEHTGEINFESFYAWYTSHRSGMMTDGAAARRIGLTAKLEVEKLKRTSELKATEDLMEAHARVVGESKMRVMFDEVDVDGSGVLDAEEVAAFVRKLKPTKVSCKRARERERQSCKQSSAHSLTNPWRVLLPFRATVHGLKAEERSDGRNGRRRVRRGILRGVLRVVGKRRLRHKRREACSEDGQHFRRAGEGTG